MKNVMLLVLVEIIGVALNWLGLSVGWWWITSAVGLLVGLFIRQKGADFLISLCMGGLSWGLTLSLLALNAPVGRTALAVESVLGLPATGGLSIIVLTIILGCILSVTGTWVGIAVRGLVR